MLRKQALHRNLSGPAGPGLSSENQITERLVKRRLLAKRIKVESRGAYKVATIDVDGHKVVGAFVRMMLYPTQPMKVHRRYYGIGLAGQTSAAFIRSLSSETIHSKIGQVAVVAGVGEHIYIAQPVEAGLPLLSYGGLEGGFYSPIVVSVNDPETHAVMDYYLFESVNDHLGQTTIEIE